MRLLFMLFLLFCGTAVHAQKYTISGNVKDASNGEELIGATVAVKELPGTGVATNVYGFYSLSLPKGSYTLIYSYIGFFPIEKTIDLQQNTTLNLELSESGTQLEEVVVEGRAEDENIASMEMSAQELKVDQVKVMPALLGEVDVIRTLTLLPGVQNASEGSTGLFVRGGSNDQNLVLLDGAPVYNASHLLGFFSVFNPDAIKDVKLYKGGIPAQFGSRLSSIVDIRMKEGNSKDLEVSGGIGSISSRLTVEGPLVKDKGSFIMSGRRTYADMFLKFANDENLRNNKLYFYDFNAKMNYSLGEKDRIFISGYFGRDVLKFDKLFGIDWGNATGTARWNHIFNQKLFMNTTVIYSSFDYGFTVNDGVQNFEWKSNLEDIQIKTDFDYFLNPNNTMVIGMNHIYHHFSPASIKPINDESIFEPIALDESYAYENAFYVGNEQKVSERIGLQYGIRYSMFSTMGKGNTYVYENNTPTSDAAIIDTVSYSGLSLRDGYSGLEPRLGVKIGLDDFSSFKASYNRTRQYVQVVAANTSSLPFDRWVPAGKYINPQIGDQIAMGYFRNFSNNRFELSVEGYYKWMRNQIDVRNGKDVLFNNNIEEAIATGRAYAYGAEFLLRKNVGKTNGWISYTWAKTQRQIQGISGGNAYSPRYDRRHDFSLVLTHEFNEFITLSGNFVYTTGAAVSFPIGKIEVDGLVVDYYDADHRNADRMPDYHRMDLSLNIKGRNKHQRKWQGTTNISLYNVYNRKNAFTITFEPNESNPDQMQAVKTALFGIVPSVTYNFRFVNRKKTPIQ